VPSSPSTIAFLLEQMEGAGDVSARKMFGEYAIYLDGKVVALVCGDQLYVKPTVAGRAFLGAPAEAPPYPGAKPCFTVDGGQWEDSERLSELIRITAAELPAPKPRRPAQPRGGSGARRAGAKT
jgi:TfoX/Sxy family transcriptional regulator of competence genes